MSTESTFKGLWAENQSQDPNDFPAIRTQILGRPSPTLKEGQVRIECHYSSINYKDALAVTGQGKILRTLPLVPGIDVSGIVLESKNEGFKTDQKVLVTGCGLGETYSGGFSSQVVAPGHAVIPLPEALSLRESMIYGTAGFTAALAVHQLEHNGLKPDQGEVLVTGATGGVGSISLQILKKRGYQTRAWTRNKEACPWLLNMGATSAESIKDKDFQTKPLASSLWAAAIDNVGGEYLSYILPRIRLWGSVASIGLAKSPLLQATVFPFILRGVNLLGVSSGNCPDALRKELWQKLADDFRPQSLEDLVDGELALEEIPNFCKKMIAGETRGRTLVKIH